MKILLSGLCFLISAFCSFAASITPSVSSSGGSSSNAVLLTTDQTVNGGKTLQLLLHQLIALGSVSGTQTVSWATNVYSLTATGATVFALSGSAPAAGVDQTVKLNFTQDGTGGRTLTIGTTLIAVDPTTNALTVVWINTSDGGSTLNAFRTYLQIVTSGTGHSLVGNPTNGIPTVKSVTAGTGITATPTTNDITISVTTGTYVGYSGGTATSLIATNTLVFVPVKAAFSTNYTVTATDASAVFLCTGTNQLITLPACASTPTGRMFTFVSATTTGSIAVTNASGAATILGALQLTVSSTNRLTVVNDGSNWW